MFIDASALVAILTREQGWEDLLRRLSEAEHIHVSPLARYETVIAIARVQSAGQAITAASIAEADGALADFLAGIAAATISLSDEIGSVATKAAATYGKVVRHEARLNLGDCFAYACAKVLKVPLLYKGDDFARTDLA